MRQAFFLSVLLLFAQCTDDSSQTETIEMDEVVPSAKGDYDYENNDTLNTQVEKDTFITTLSRQLQLEVKALTSVQNKDGWRYSPDRLKNDTSLTKWMLIDNTEYVYKYWGYPDSLLSINSLYNWMDCFGSNCTGISIGDSVNVSEEGFLLFQNNHAIHFLKSGKSININKWEKILNDEHKKAPWNYVIRQRPGGTIDWIRIPD